MSSPNSNNVCKPIKNLTELCDCLENPPEWTNWLIDRVPRSQYVIKNEPSDCHIKSESCYSSPRLDARSVPRTIVCHDMKGGYLQDR